MPDTPISIFMEVIGVALATAGMGIGFLLNTWIGIALFTVGAMLFINAYKFRGA